MKFNALPPDIKKEAPEKIALWEQARMQATKDHPGATDAELDDYARDASGAGSQVRFRLSMNSEAVALASISPVYADRNAGFGPLGARSDAVYDERFGGGMFWLTRAELEMQLQFAESETRILTKKMMYDGHYDYPVPESTAERILADTNDLFTRNTFVGLLDSQYPGMNTSRLRDSMWNVHANLDIVGALSVIGEMYDLSADEVNTQYERYVTARFQAEESAYARGFDRNGNSQKVPALDYDKHYSHMASEWQLRFGDVVGRAFGLNPVFGALLSPTGGIVGAGNNRLSVIGDFNNIEYHGVVHDAGGYLRNYHETGPGYDYLKRESFLSASSPFTGQVTGVWYWAVAKDPQAYKEFWSSLTKKASGY